MNDPLVSVAITAYNLAALLPRAVESALKQQTDFAFEILIANNCSTDDTSAVAQRYQAQYPSIVRVIERSENIGIQRNYFETFQECKGKYIAWLDADDEWTDPQKLVIQAAVLEADPSVAIVGHMVRWVTREGEVKRDAYPSLPAGRYGIKEIVEKNFLPAPSVMFRNGVHRNLPAWYFDIAPLTDWPLYVVAARTGAIVVLEGSMADYTLNPGGSLWGKGEIFWYELDARFYEVIDSILPEEFHRLAHAQKGKRYEEIAYFQRKKGEFIASREAAVKAFLAPAILDNVSSKTKSLLASIVREAQWRLGSRSRATE